MNKEDKQEYHFSIVKNMARKCHSRCFNRMNTIEINNNCLNACYHKYINTVNKLRKLTIQKGAKNHSEFIESVFKPNTDDVTEFFFPPGGSYAVPPGWFWYSPPNKSYLRSGYSPYREEMENN